ncbi:MAG: LptE family protein [Pirellulaceae bacterium]
MRNVRKLHCTAVYLTMMAASAVLLAGCASYQYGNDALFPVGITTVHVPIVQNDTFRHDLGPQLTEAIVKELERRSNYKVTGDPNADSTLQVRIVSETKRVLSEARTDDPRAIDAALSVRASWISRNGQQLMQNSAIPIDDNAISFGQNVRFVPEAGQSVDTAMQRAIEQLASRVVSQMEMRW